jgi:hypothetical protein
MENRNYFMTFATHRRLYRGTHGKPYCLRKQHKSLSSCVEEGLIPEFSTWAPVLLSLLVVAAAVTICRGII